VVESPYPGYWRVEGLRAAGFEVAHPVALPRCDGLQPSGDEEDAAQGAPLWRWGWDREMAWAVTSKGAVILEPGGRAKPGAGPKPSWVPTPPCSRTCPALGEGRAPVSRREMGDITRLAQVGHFAS
jgi:hypothetical protein